MKTVSSQQVESALAKNRAHLAALEGELERANTELQAAQNSVVRQEANIERILGEIDSVSALIDVVVDATTESQTVKHPAGSKLPKKAVKPGKPALTVVEG